MVGEPITPAPGRQTPGGYGRPISLAHSVRRVGEVPTHAATSSRWETARRVPIFASRQRSSSSPGPVRRTVTRSPAQRLIAILMAALFSLGGEGAGLLRHACPHHDLGPAGIAGMQASAGAADHDGHAQHGAASSSTEDVSARDDDGGHSRHGEGGACTCPGVCEAGSGKPLPSVLGAVVRIAVSGDSDHLPSLHEAAPRGLTPYLLPYANAPPRAG